MSIKRQIWRIKFTRKAKKCSKSKCKKKVNRKALRIIKSSENRGRINCYRMRIGELIPWRNRIRSIVSHCIKPCWMFRGRVSTGLPWASMMRPSPAKMLLGAEECKWKSWRTSKGTDMTRWPIWAINSPCSCLFRKPTRWTTPSQASMHSEWVNDTANQ